MAIPIQRPTKRKIILIQGSGLGKSFVGDAIVRVYIYENVPFRIFTVGSLEELKLVLASTRNFRGYVLITTNLFVSNLMKRHKPWQTITLEGGFFDCSTTGHDGVKSQPGCSCLNKSGRKESQGKKQQQ